MSCANLHGKKTTRAVPAAGEGVFPHPIPSLSHPYGRCPALETPGVPVPPQPHGHSPPPRLSRRNWPLERCWSPKLRAIFSHIVPLPEPGGPSTTARNSLDAITGDRCPTQFPTGGGGGRTRRQTGSTPPPLPPPPPHAPPRRAEPCRSPRIQPPRRPVHISRAGGDRRAAPPPRPLLRAAAPWDL